jgi:hypothetical protein
LVLSYSANPSTLASIDGLDSWPERHLIELRHLLHPGNRLVLLNPMPIREALKQLAMPVPHCRGLYFNRTCRRG